MGIRRVRKLLRFLVLKDGWHVVDYHEMNNLPPDVVDFLENELI